MCVRALKSVFWEIVLHSSSHNHSSSVSIAMKLITRFAFELSFSLSLSLSPLPPNISPYDNNSGTGAATRSAILRAVDASLTKAVEAGETLIEVR